DVHRRPGDEHLEALPLGLREELVRRPAALVLDRLPRHLDEAAERDRRDLVLRAAAGESQQPGTEADRERQHADADAARGEVVAELVDENEHADDENESERRGHDGVVPCTFNSKVPEKAAARTRAQRSTARTSSSVSASCTSCAAMVCSMTCAMAGNARRPPRNASTATSLAAFRTIGMVPPVRSAR